MKRVEYLRLPNGREPAREWLMELEINIRMRIRTYIDRVAAGGSRNNIKALDHVIFEIKIHFGSGYRVYFVEQGKTLLLLLLGGDKSSQKKDIQKAQQYWREYVSKQSV